uniref:DUF448 domain-containing protein n=1 Tax=Syphacia muris TaxID=451379 RepID=A0A0N5AHG5_9BILA
MLKKGRIRCEWRRGACVRARKRLRNVWDKSENLNITTGQVERGFWVCAVAECVAAAASAAELAEHNKMALCQIDRERINSVGKEAK